MRGIHWVIHSEVRIAKECLISRKTALKHIKGSPSQWSSFAHLDFSSLVLTGQQGKSELTTCLFICTLLYFCVLLQEAVHDFLYCLVWDQFWEIGFGMHLGGFFLMEPVLDNMSNALVANAKIWRSRGQAVMGFWTVGTSRASLGWTFG